MPTTAPKPPSNHPMPLCQHTLADWRRILAWCDKPRIRVTALLFFLRLAARGEEGLPYEDALPDWMKTQDSDGRRRTGYHSRRQYQRQYPQYLRKEREGLTGRLFALPALMEALGLRDAAHAASLARVLEKLMRQGFGSLAVGLLVHASKDPARITEYLALPWTKDCKHRPEVMAKLIGLGLMHRASPRTETGNTWVGIHSLTSAGKALLLGQWGRAGKGESDGKR
jgi:hypothetical protein